ncbi:hypothetical protein [Mammaliicoccus fleurettii]|uniref:hypothetical protein n=2 Tax=Mammaliicoccus fleurettii TaxID=150056 RepID=UPI000E03C0B9|nr:hypothetical protein [Mammaliicoccus fleurettii]SUM37841.1 Uncharacterised protein [Mammaliicoccus fleurettii]HCN60023.1 hypothetical protein [Staphylococcus sp.]
METYEDTNIQFLYDFKITNAYFIEKDEPKLYKIYELLKLFDGVMYHTVKAQQHFIENFKLYSKANEKEFNYLVEATYHLNYCIRNISTLDDIMNRIIVEIYLYMIPTARLKSRKSDYIKDYYYSTILKDELIEIKLPAVGKINRNTKNTRHIATHNGITFIVENVIEENGMSAFYGFDSSIIKEKQTKTLNKYRRYIYKDLEKAKISIIQIKKVLFPILDEVDRRYF